MSGVGEAAERDVDGAGGPASGADDGARVAEAEVRPYRLPLADAYRSARGERTHREGWLLRLGALDGTVGWGEAAPLPGRTEDREAAGRGLEAAAGALGGGPAEGDRLREALPEGSPAAAHALGVALADMEARRAGESLAVRWARRFERDDVGADGDSDGAAAGPLDRVPVNATLPMETPERMAARAREAVDRGFDCLKIKVGDSATRDLHRLTAVRREVGPEPALRLDANASWSRREARSRLLRLEPYGVEYVEQPLPADDLEGLGLLRAESGTDVRVAADESASTLRRVRRLAEDGLVDVVVLKPGVLGPPDRTLEAARVARRHGLEVVVTTCLGAAVERAAALHLASAVGAPLPPCGLATGELLDDDVTPAPSRPEDGMLAVPLDRPGIAVAPRGEP